MRIRFYFGLLRRIFVGKISFFFLFYVVYVDWEVLFYFLVLSGSKDLDLFRESVLFFDRVIGLRMDINI